MSFSLKRNSVVTENSLSFFQKPENTRQNFFRFYINRLREFVGVRSAAGTLIARVFPITTPTPMNRRNWIPSTLLLVTLVGASILLIAWKNHTGSADAA